MPLKQWESGPGWVRLPRLIEALARISPAPAAALLLACEASSSAWPAGEALYDGPVELRLECRGAPPRHGQQEHET